MVVVRCVVGGGGGVGGGGVIRGGVVFCGDIVGFKNYAVFNPGLIHGFACRVEGEI